MDVKSELNEFFVSCFYSILSAEERTLESITNGKLTLKEIHLIDAVFQSKDAGENNFSSIAKRLGVTLGTLTTSYAKLEKKGYLVKVQDKKDKRIFYIEPTRLAALINNEHAAFHKNMINGVEKSLSAEELLQLTSVLKKLRAFFDAL